MPAPISGYSVAPEAFAVKDALDTVLAAMVSVYAAHNMPLPARRYWTIGDPVWDCEQAVISYMQTYLGSPGDEATQPLACDGPKSMVINISVIRQQTLTKSGAAPSAESIQQDAEWAAVDSWIIMDCLKDFSAWGPGPAPGMIATASVPPPSGGYQGVLVSMTMLVP